MPMTEQNGDARLHWLLYFTVPSSDGAVMKIQQLGGGVPVGPFEVPAGRISVVRDPQSVAFAIFEGETDD